MIEKNNLKCSARRVLGCRLFSTFLLKELVK
jgi:hypothetical protein